MRTRGDPQKDDRESKAVLEWPEEGPPPPSIMSLSMSAWDRIWEEGHLSFAFLASRTVRELETCTLWELVVTATGRCVPVQAPCMMPMFFPRSQ